MAESCESVVSSVVTGVASHGQTKAAETPSQEDAETSGTLGIGMLEPILAEDCTYTKLVPSLERVLNDLNENSTHHDYMVALVIVLLAEAGFYLSSTNNNYSRPKLRSLHVPKDWKSQETGVYEMYFQLETVPDIKCKLVACPLGDTLILNFFPLIDGKITYTITVQTLKYVNPYSSDLCGRYMKLKEISHRFKDKLSTPVRSDILHKAGVMGPSLQALPTELKLRILRLLDVCSLTRIAQCCSEFHELCSDAQLKRYIILERLECRMANGRLKL